jgi:hypothetical protein
MGKIPTVEPAVTVGFGGVVVSREGRTRAGRLPSLFVGRVGGRRREGGQGRAVVVGISSAFGSASFALVLVLTFSFAFLAFLFSDIKCISAARGTFSGHVTVLLE